MTAPGTREGAQGVAGGRRAHPRLPQFAPRNSGSPSPEAASGNRRGAGLSAAPPAPSPARVPGSPLVAASPVRQAGGAGLAAGDARVENTDRKTGCKLHAVSRCGLPPNTECVL